MALIKVEILVKGHNSPNAGGSKAGDIITIQPPGHPWAKFDLKNKFLFCVDLDVPCGNEFMKTKRCNRHCEHTGILWKASLAAIIVGTKGYLKTTCPVHKYNVADVEFEVTEINPLALTIDEKVMNYKTTVTHKSAYKIDYTSILSASTINKIVSGTKPVEGVERSQRLADAKNNPILEIQIIGTSRV